jgi:hypothetical protein
MIGPAKVPQVGARFNEVNPQILASQGLKPPRVALIRPPLSTITIPNLDEPSCSRRSLTKHRVEFSLRKSTQITNASKAAPLSGASPARRISLAPLS